VFVECHPRNETPGPTILPRSIASKLEKLVLEKEEKRNDGSRARERTTFLRCRPLEVRNGSSATYWEIGLGTKLDDDELVETDHRWSTSCR